MNTKPVQDYIIQSEENLRIAEAVTEALPNARHRLAEDFLTRLDTRLKERFPGWRSKNDDTFFRDRYATYGFGKPGWSGQYKLALLFGEYGKEMAFGVVREKDNVGNRPFCDGLLRAVREVEVDRRVETNAWWEALIYMDSPAENWQRADVLWRMHTDNKFLEDVAEQLLELATISERIIDKLVRQYRRSMG